MSRPDFKWETDPEVAFVELAQEYWAAIHHGIYQLAQRYAPEIENWMKSNAPWQDRSGGARQTLFSDVEDIAGTMIDLIMSHGVEYGRFLEMNYGGRWAIVGPALDYFAPKIWADVQNLLK